MSLQESSTMDEATEEYYRVRNAAFKYYFSEKRDYGRDITLIELSRYVNTFVSQYVPVPHETLARWFSSWKRQA